MATPNLSEIITTTLRNRTGKLADNVSDNNAILYRMKLRGRSRPASGGRTLVQELSYAENSTFMWYSGYDPLDVSESDVISAAEFDWKQCAVAVTISGLEQLQNAGKEKILDLMESRIDVAEKLGAQVRQHRLKPGLVGAHADIDRTIAAIRKAGDQRGKLPAHIG